MSSAARVQRTGRSPQAAAVVVASAALGLGLASFLTTAKRMPSTGLAAAGALLVLAAAALAIARLDATVTLGMATLGIVRVEPGPPDLLLGMAIAVTLASGRVTLRRTPRDVLTLSGVLLALTVVSLMPARAMGHAVAFLGITAYMLLLGTWLCGYVDRERRAHLVATAYVAGATVSAAIGALALLTPLPGRNVLLLGGCCRAKVLFKDPNVFGPFLVPAALLVLHDLVAPRLWPERRGSKVAVLVVLAVGILDSYSRAAWLNLVVGVVVMLLALALRRRGGRALGVALASLALLAGGGAAVVAATGSASFLQ